MLPIVLVVGDDLYGAVWQDGVLMWREGQTCSFGGFKMGDFEGDVFFETIEIGVDGGGIPTGGDNYFHSDVGVVDCS